jgi:hypothetical protein
MRHSMTLKYLTELSPVGMSAAGGSLRLPASLSGRVSSSG